MIRELLGKELREKGTTPVEAALTAVMKLGAMPVRWRWVSEQKLEIEAESNGKKIVLLLRVTSRSRKVRRPSRRVYRMKVLRIAIS